MNLPDTLPNTLTQDQMSQFGGASASPNASQQPTAASIGNQPSQELPQTITDEQLQQAVGGQLSQMHQPTLDALQKLKTNPIAASQHPDVLSTLNGFFQTIMPTQHIVDAFMGGKVDPLGIAGDVLQDALWFTPVGRIAGLAGKGLEALGLGAKAAGFGGKVAAGAATGYGFDTANRLQQGQAPGAPGIGTAIGAAIPFASPLAKGAGALGKMSLGVTTGVGSDVLGQSFKAGFEGGASQEALRGARTGTLSPDEMVREAQGALGKVMAQRSANYKTALATLPDKTHDVQPIFDALDKALKDFKIDLTAKGSGADLDFSRSVLRFDKEAQAEISNIYSTMKNFGSHAGDKTTIGIDDLKQSFSSLYSESSQARAFVARMEDAAKGVLKNEPAYNKMESAYAKDTALIKQVQKAFSLKDPNALDTAFRKLSSSLRINNEERKRLVEELNKYSKTGALPSMIAGQQASEFFPRGLMRQIGVSGEVLGGLYFGGLTHLLPVLQGAVMMSPRIVSGFLERLGIGSRVASDIIQKLAPTGTGGIGTKTAIIAGEKASGQSANQ